MRGNLCHEQDHPHHNQKTEHEILDEMGEVKERFNDDLEAMEQQARQHGEDQNEYIELISFSRAGNTDQ